MIPLPHHRRRALLAIAGAVCALFAGIVCVLIWRKPASQSIANILKEVGFDQRLGDDVPLDLVFRNEEGRDVALSDCFKKRPVVLSFVYYQCPMLCSQVQDGLVHSLRAMNLEPGEDFEVVTVSIDARDTLEMAARKKASCIADYGKPSAAPHWHFLTSPTKSKSSAPGWIASLGSIASPTSSASPTSPTSPASPASPTSIGGPAPTGDSAALLARKVGFRYFYDEQADQFAHASGIVVLTPTGQVSKYFYGIEYSPRDLRLALVEASSGEIGTWMDQALLLCYHYDPMTGAYGVVILTVIRLFGILTVLMIAGLLVVLLRRERRMLHLPAGGS